MWPQLFSTVPMTCKRSCPVTFFFSAPCCAFPLSHFQCSFATLLFLELIKSVFPGGGGERFQSGREAVSPSYGVFWLQLSVCPFEHLYFPHSTCYTIPFVCNNISRPGQPTLPAHLHLMGTFMEFLPPSYSRWQSWELVFVPILVNYCFQVKKKRISLRLLPCSCGKWKH